MCEIRCYELVEDSATTWLHRVTNVDFAVVTSTLLMFNINAQKFDKVAIKDGNKNIVGSFTLANGFVLAPRSQPKPELRHYLIAGLFTGDLP